MVVEPVRFKPHGRPDEAVLAARNSSGKLCVGRVIGGSYVLLEELGSGGMGLVYRAKHVALDKTVALKILSPHCVSESSWLRFQSEARLLGSLQHPSIVRVFDMGIDKSNLPFYAMELVEGQSLDDKLQSGAFPLPDALEIFIAVLDALACVHNKGVVHRDIKPGNIFIADRQPGTVASFRTRVKLLDFGIAKIAGRRRQQLTSKNEMLGSPAYMSPEQVEGRRVDPRSDIYAVGCALFETLTGELPFDGETMRKIGNHHLESRPPSLTETLPRTYFPESIEFVVAKCLAKDPDARYQSALELKAELLKIKAGKFVCLSQFNHSRGALLAVPAAQSQLIEDEQDEFFERLSIGYESSLILGLASLMFVSIGLIALICSSY